jgi:hypothetical protein
MPSPSIQLQRRAVKQHSGGYVLHVTAAALEAFPTAKVFIWFQARDEQPVRVERVAQPQDLRDLSEAPDAALRRPYYRHDEFLAFCATQALLDETWQLLCEDVNALVADENNLGQLTVDASVVLDGSELPSAAPAPAHSDYVLLFGKRVGDHILLSLNGTTIYVPAVEEITV